MYPFKKILVGLDNGDQDPNIIQFASFFAQSTYAETIYFVNVIRKTSVPEEVAKEFPGIMEQAIEERKKHIEKKVTEIVKNTNLKLEYVVAEGSPARKLLEITHELDIDFVIIGRGRMKRTSVVAQRMARRATCSLMIVPVDGQPDPRTILVPCDFSKHSHLALEEAIAIADRSPEKIDIVCQNVFTVPVGYHYTGKSYEDFAQIMEKNARSDFKKFVKKIDFKGQEIGVTYTLDKDEDPVEDIYNYAKELEAELVIIGAKGRTSSTALFLGSKAERFIQINDSIPMMLIRPKGTASGWLDYIKEL